MKIGVKGAYVHGTTGEGVSLGHEEKKSLTKAWLDARAAAKADKDFLLIVNVSSCVVHETLDHAKYCNDLGVDGIAFLPPFYYRPASVGQLAKYVKVVADAAPDLPLLYYHFPEMTNIDFPLGLFLQQVVNEVPSFAALKYTSKDIVQLTNIQREFGTRVKIFVGYEESMLAAFAVGLDSGVCAQFSFPECVKSYNKIVDNVGKDIGKAREGQEELAKVAKELAVGSFVANVKRRLTRDLHVGGARLPIIE